MSIREKNYAIYELTIEDPDDQGDQLFHGIFGILEEKLLQAYAEPKFVAAPVYIAAAPVTRSAELVPAAAAPVHVAAASVTRSAELVPAAAAPVHVPAAPVTISAVAAPAAPVTRSAVAAAAAPVVGSLVEPIVPAPVVAPVVAAPVVAAPIVAAPVVAAKNKYICLILGKGCIKKNSETYKAHLLDEFNKKYPTLTIDVMCNDSSIGTTVSVVSELVCRIPISENNSFLTNIYDKLVLKLKDPAIDEVFLVGQSYGGMVASVIAKKANKDSTINKDNKDKLKIVTLGSIYIPKLKEINTINIVHYMHQCDVALKCNGLDAAQTAYNIKDEEYYDENTRVYWDISKTCPLPVKTSWFGSKEERDIHKDYHFKDILVKFLENQPMVSPSVLRKTTK